jgi:hypothetical protein
VFVGTHRGTRGLHKVCTCVPTPYSLTARVRTLAEEVAVACRVQRILEAVILFPVRIRHSQGFSRILSESWLFAVLSQIVFALSFFLTLVFVFSVKKSVQAFKGSWLSISVVSSWFWVVCFHFFSEFRYTRGLYKVSPCVHALCLYTACVRTLAVRLTVACLYMILFVEGKAVILSLDKNYTSQVFESLS